MDVSEIYRKMAKKTVKIQEAHGRILCGDICLHFRIIL